MAAHDRRSEDPVDAFSVRASNDDFKDIRKFIEVELGVKMPTSKVPMLASRLRRRVQSLGLRNFEEYGNFVLRSLDGKKELVAFIDAVTTHKTDFWREPEHFEFLANVALPKLDATLGVGRTTKVWSAGCSTGEEPYTLAMVLAEHCRTRAGADFAILATDVSEPVLEHGRVGIYDAERVEPLPVHLANRYVRKSVDKRSNKVRMPAELRSCISFHVLNFMQEDYRVADVFDAIFMRNVLIYFDEPTQARVVRRLCKNLRPGGFFFTGQSESLARADVPLKHSGPAVYIRH